jgi:hypothetical protein
LKQLSKRRDASAAHPLLENEKRLNLSGASPAALHLRIATHLKQLAKLCGAVLSAY